MRAMIQAAGLGTRLRPLSELRPKAAMPVRGLPLIAYSLAWLARQEIREVVINLHHGSEAIQNAVERYCPRGLAVQYSHEAAPLGTGGGIRRAQSFLRESDPSLVIAGDMLLDLDLAPLRARHGERGDAVTLLLREDTRAARFGTIGLDAGERVRRIARRLDLGGETCAGVYVSVRLIAARAFDTLPEREAFVDLDDWLGPLLGGGAADVRGVLLGPERWTWEPVGTPAEYLAANLQARRLSYLDADARAQAEGTRFQRDLVIGAGAELGAGTRLRRAVVWDGEKVHAGLRACDGVFAGGAFHPCVEGDPGA